MSLKDLLTYLLT